MSPQHSDRVRCETADVVADLDGYSKGDLNGFLTLYLPFPFLQRSGVQTGRNYPHDLEKSQYHERGVEKELREVTK